MARGLCRADIDNDRALVVAALGPAPKRWTIDRLTTLVTVFTLGRVAPDPRQLALWMSETSRLLANVPHDILAHSIDLAVQSSRHGFMPSVGEIQAVAAPLAAERSQQLDRLDQMLSVQWPDASDAPFPERRAPFTILEQMRDMGTIDEAGKWRP